MHATQHTFHIPVMGTGHSVDTAIRVAPFGISSVISLVDDVLLERVRMFYCKQYGLAYTKLFGSILDGRAKRITAYLDTVKEIVALKLDAIRKQPFFAENDKRKYFELLPDDCELKNDYERLLAMDEGPERTALESELTDRMEAGSIDVNIMVKLDRINYDSNGNPLSDAYRDAKAALRGFAMSGVSSSMVFSAGINQTLFTYMAQFKDFYRDAAGEIKKRIILKVSDFRSALIQGKFLARKGLEVYEFRIESGLNCGGHAFPSNGHLLPCLLQEFKEKKDQLMAQFRPLIEKYYEAAGNAYPREDGPEEPLITVQGGIGTRGEERRLREDFGMDMTGWASPFLLVPEATCVDDPTRELLRQARAEDLYLSDVSPLGIAFNNVRRTGSEVWTKEKAAGNNPGSACPKGFLVSNTEYTERPICLASKEFQQDKLREIDGSSAPPEEKERLRAAVVEKTCICDHLGNGALIALGMAKPRSAPQSICPGPNIAWFNRVYTLREMVDHIYGRGPSLVPPERPHMFAKEVAMYVDYFEKLVDRCGYSPGEIKEIEECKRNLEAGMDFCLEVAKRSPYPTENLASIAPSLNEERVRLRAKHAEFARQAHPQPAATATA